jgi:uncharacterized protein
MTARIEGQVLYPGSANGPLLKLNAPLSFWGGIDPATGRIINVRHPDYGQYVGGVVLALTEPIGSSSSSSVMLEPINRRHAPAAVLLGKRDAILVVGCFVAKELGMQPPPVLFVDTAILALLRATRVAINDNCIALLQ